MATIITTTCDRCKKEIVDRDQIWRLSLSRACCPAVPNKMFPEVKAEWCRPCMIEMHLLGHGKVIENVTPVSPAPTMEDYVREMVREEIGNAR